MESWQEWGYSFIQAVQAYHTPAATLLFKALSLMGEEEFYLLFMPFLYWLADKRVALRFTILFLFSAYLNTFLKGLVAEPRPSPERVTVLLEDPGGGGLPSGHSQNALVSWGFLARERPMPWFRWAMLALILGISFSRIYLGVHFPHDVLGGWLAGALLLATYYALSPTVTRWFEQQSVQVQMAVGAAVPLLLALLYTEDTAFRVMAALFGIALAVPLERATVSFSTARRDLLQVAGRLLVGLAVLLLIRSGLKLVLDPLGLVGTFVRYALIGAWVAGGAPWLFVRFGLAEREGAVRSGLGERELSA